MYINRADIGIQKSTYLCLMLWIAETESEPNICKHTPVTILWLSTHLMAIHNYQSLNEYTKYTLSHLPLSPQKNMHCAVI